MVLADEVGFEETIVADDVDQPGDAPRVPVNQLHRLGLEDLPVGAAGDLQTVTDVRGGGVEPHGAETIAQGHPLLQRLVEGERLVQAPAARRR